MTEMDTTYADRWLAEADRLATRRFTRAVAWRLAHYADAEGVLAVSVGEVARDLGSSPRGTSQAVGRLHDLGLLANLGSREGVTRRRLTIPECD
ncbi:hypothetical protein [Arsenicicoccus dermatophilus]|uniref:hypothetical protein n=1 Tax=Arsenicicoccus dermatophilus TaxID=1076331 RepID=UPI001F4C944E|nr:hypothetical protein [Arsenicicoccus dermatophilus]MCH8613565.1 hypothetical protein [Arsenicicoccus dermatophilus]